MEPILRLFPLPHEQLPLSGAYLAHDLRSRARQHFTQSGRPYLYANFITSLDGRIAISRPGEKELAVPKQITNPRDWRLFQELAAQADLVISSGRYLREWAVGKAQEILQVDDPRFADLRQWREAQGLAPQPDLAILSASLQFPISDVLTAGGRSFIVFTPEGADPARVAEIERRGGKVVTANGDALDGGKLAAQMAAFGYRAVYSAAGPQILHLLASGGALNRLYLTFAFHLLGGDPYAGVVDGPLLEHPPGFSLYSLHLDPGAPGGHRQLFAAFDCQEVELNT